MYSAISSCDDRSVCQVETEKIFDRDLGAPLSACVNEIGIRTSYMLTALHNLYQKLYTGGAYEENPGFKPEVDGSMAASIAEIYEILSKSEEIMDEIVKKL